MQVRSLVRFVVLLLLALACSPIRGEAQNKLPVTVVTNIGDQEFIDRAIFSPNKQLVATFDGGWGSSIKLWDVASGRLLRMLKYEAYFNAFVFTPDGRWIASAHKDGKIKLWDITTGAITDTLQTRSRARSNDGTAAVTSLWIDTKGDLLISGDDAGLITVWSAPKREWRRSFKFGKVPEGINSNILALRLNADRTKVTAVTEASVKTFDINSGKVIAAFDLPNEYPWWNSKQRKVFSADSIVGDDELIVRYLGPGCEIPELMSLNLKDTKSLVTIDKPDNCEKSEKGSPTIYSSPSQANVIIARSGASEIKQWDPQTGSTTRAIKWPIDTHGEILAFDQDFKRVMSQKANNGRIREFESGASVSELPSYESYSAEVAATSRDGRRILLSHNSSRPETKQKDIVLWQIDALSPKYVQLTADKETVIRDFAPDAMLALAANARGEIVIFSIETGREQHRFSVADLKDVREARLSPDGKLAALVGSDADDKSIAVLVDASDGTVKHRFAGRDERNGMMASTGRDDENDLVTAMVFSPDGTNVAVGRWNGTAEIWNTQRIKRVKLLPASRKDGDQIWSLDFSTDGKHLIAGSRNSGVFQWNVATGRLIRTFLYDGLAGHVHVASVAMSHDRKLVAGGLAQHAVSSGDIGAEHGIKVWNASTGKLRFTLRGHDGGVGAVTFSSDDQCVISASFDGTIRYWNSTNGKLVATLNMAEDGRWVLTTEGGFFAGTPGSEELLNIVRGLKSLPISQFHDQLYRPDLVEQFLKGDREHIYSTAAQKLNLEEIWDSRSVR